MKNTIEKIKTVALDVTFFTVMTSLLIILTLTVSSCNNDNSKPEDSKKVATEQNEQKFSGAAEEDAKFLVHVASVNMKEIKLGQLAQTNGTIQSVKDLGKMMETDHTKALKELQDLASKKQITLPDTLTNKGEDAYDKLARKNGKDFDKEYCDMMVKGHKETIEKFEKESTDANDPDIKAFASSMLPTLREHLDHSMICQKECSK